LNISVETYEFIYFNSSFVLLLGKWAGPQYPFFIIYTGSHTRYLQQHLALGGGQALWQEGQLEHGRFVFLEGNNV
jgi:hypothetical protein